MRNETISIDSIKRHPDFKNSRHTVGGLEDLCASIANEGVLNPLVVWESDSHMYLVSGFRRMAAIETLLRDDPEALGGGQVPVRVFEGDLKGAARINLAENIQREDLSPLEIGEYLEHLTNEFGYRPEEVAEVIGKSPAFVYGHRAFLKDAIPALVSAIREKEMSYTLGLDISKKPAKRQAELVEKHKRFREELKSDRKAASATRKELAEDTKEEKPTKEPKTPKKGARRPAGDIQAKLEAYMSTDWSELDSDVQAFIFGIQKGLAFALNHEVDFSEIVPFTFDGFTDVPVIPEATSAPEEEEDDEVLEGFTESW